MTEEEWLTGSDPLPMLSFLRDNADVIKLRLLRVAAARLEWDRIPDGPHRRVIEAAEDHIEGRISADELAEHNSTMYRMVTVNPTPGQTDWITEELKPSKAHDFSRDSWGDAVNLHSLCHATCQSERLVKVANAGATWNWAVRWLGQRLPPLIRDIFGNPFRPVVIDPAWLSPAVLELAQAIYSDRSFDRMPELAGLLEGAGCADAGILTHCRAGEAHARGCYVIDLILCKL